MVCKSVLTMGDWVIMNFHLCFIALFWYNYIFRNYIQEKHNESFSYYFTIWDNFLLDRTFLFYWSFSILQVTFWFAFHFFWEQSSSVLQTYFTINYILYVKITEDHLFLSNYTDLIISLFLTGFYVSITFLT